VKKQELRAIAWKAFEEALKDFYYPPIPEPKIIYSRRIKEILKIDENTWDIQLNIAATPKLPKDELERFYRVIWRKTIAYYVVCPYDPETALKIFSAAVRASDENIGRMATNLLIEFIIAGYLSKLFRDDLVWFYRLLSEKFKSYLRKNETLAIISIIVLENLLGISLVPQKLIKNLSKEIINAADDIYKVVIRGGFLSRNMWFEKAHEIAIILTRILKSKRRRTIKKAGKTMHEIFQRDILDTALLLSTMKSTEVSESLEKMHERVISTMIADSSDIVRVSPAIMTLRIFKKPKEIVRYWYRKRARGKIEIHLLYKEKRKKSSIQTPTTWHIGYPPEELDIVLSLSSFPKMLPNVTTKKWDRSEIEIKEGISNPPNLLIILDSSGSMGYFPGWKKPRIDKRTEEYRILRKLGLKYPIGSKFDIALTAAFAVVEYALMRNVRIAVINFSGKGIVCDWTNERRKIEDCLMIYQGDGTELPTKKIRNILSSVEERILVILITDAEIFNVEETIECLREIIQRGHYLYVFHIEEPGKYPILENAERLGGSIIRVRNIEELTDIIIGKIRKYYTVV